MLTRCFNAPGPGLSFLTHNGTRKLVELLAVKNDPWSWWYPTFFTPAHFLKTSQNAMALNPFFQFLILFGQTHVSRKKAFKGRMIGANTC